MAKKLDVEAFPLYQTLISFCFFLFQNRLDFLLKSNEKNKKMILKLSPNIKLKSNY